MRRSVLWFAVTCAALMVLVIWLARTPANRLSTAITTSGSASQASSERLASTAGASKAERSVHADNQTRPVTPTTSAPPPPSETKSELIREGLAEMNDVPIVFYGKLVDQFGNPVAGAQITGSTIIYNGVKSGAQRVSVTSEANGLFQIKAGKGESLGIWPRKEGYALATTHTEFKFSYMYDDRYSPDPNNPAIIKMWKLQGAEPLTGIDQRYKFHFPEAPVSLDLLTGKIVPVGGDIRITIGRSPGVVSERTLQDWSVQIEAVDGGLIEASAVSARMAYKLPDNGYQTQYIYSMSTNTRSWHGSLNETFYLRSRNGQIFSKLNFGVSINQQPNDLVSVEVHGEANTNSSSNFEADANAMAMKPQ